MKTHLKLIAVLFLAGFALLGQSCAEEEFPPRPGPAFPADVTNRYALLLQEQLQADGAAYDRYTEVLSDRTPVYEEVRFATHSAYGLCYIIPYCSPSGPTIEGAVYLPARATCAEDGTVTFDGSLGTPIDIDAPTINRDIPFTERYTYSMPFKHLQDKGWNVDPELLLYAELLDNKILPLSPEDFPDGFIHTKATVNILEICMRYESEYVGGRTDAVIGMHPDLLIRVIEESLKRLGIRDLDNPCQHRFLTMIISIPENKLPSYSVNVFIDQLMFEIRQALIVQGFELSIQYTFEFKPYTVSGGSSTGESGGTGGSSGGRGSGASTPTQPSSFKEPLKDNSAMSKQIQQESVELWESLSSIKDTTLGINTYISFKTYLDEVAKDPKDEHATLLIDYEDEDHTRVLTEVFHGTEDNVIQTYSSNYVAAQVHNHPNGSPPSAQDLLFTAEMMREENNYQATFVYNHEDKSYYSLYAYEPEAGGNLYQALKNEIDPVTHDFKSGGECDKILKTMESTYKNFSSEIMQIYRLCAVIEEFGKGIAVTKYNPETKKNEVYRVEKGKDKKGNVVYAPLICK